MEAAVYRQFYELEANHWWFVGMRIICRGLLTPLPGLNGHRGDAVASTVCLDIGCGTGLWTRELEMFGPVVGLDLSPEALAFCQTRRLPRLVQASADRLPVSTGSCRLITALGLLEHVEDDRQLVMELARATAPGGYVLVLTSAYQALWSEHDEAVHHKRRYTRPQLRRLLQGEEFEIMRLTYVNILLLVPVVVLRVVRRLTQRRKASIREGTQDVFAVPSWLNGLLTGLLRFESWMLRSIELPCGLGLLAVMRRRSS